MAKPKISAEQRARILELHKHDPRSAVAYCEEIGVTPRYGAVLAWKEKNPQPRKRGLRPVDKKWEKAKAAGPVTA